MLAAEAEAGAAVDAARERDESPRRTKGVVRCIVEALGWERRGGRGGRVRSFQTGEQGNERG